jgi:hypothetical protein
VAPGVQGNTVRGQGLSRYSRGMENGFGTLALHFAAPLIAGLAASLGTTFWARGKRGQARLLTMSGWLLGLTSLVAVLAGVAAAWWLVHPMLNPGEGGWALPGPLSLAVVGVLVGLPLSVPAVVLSWRDARARERTRRVRARATKDDRRAYALDLVRQIQDVSPGTRTLQATVGGEGGTVLSFRGDLGAKEGERLTAALRVDLQELGFKRVEGESDGKSWWARV